jgi:hypothetical protein
VNIGGMCCTMSTGTGNVDGSRGSSSASAFGPPVDTAMTTASGATGPAEATRDRDDSVDVPLTSAAIPRRTAARAE